MTTPPQAQLIANKATIQQQAVQLQHPQHIAIIREKLKELGPGPYTEQQQKLRDSYLIYLSKDTTNVA